MKKNIKGITLIALVITIIVLLILAGVSIAMLTSDNGIITKAIRAKEESEKAAIEEQLKLAEISLKTKKYGGDITDINEYLAEVALTDMDFEEQDNLSQYGDYDAVLLINEKYLYGLKIVDGDIKIEYIGKPGKLAPKIELSEITQTTSTITVKVTTKRNDGGKLEYYIKEQNNEDYELKETQEDTQYTYEGLEQNKTYIIKIVAIASNGETAKIEEEITLGKVADLTEQNTTFTYSTDEWTNGSVTVTASTQITGYTIQTSKDGTSWNNTATQTFTANGTMYVRLWDGKNYGGSATANVDKIDTESPNSFTPTAEHNDIELKDASDEIKETYNFAEATYSDYYQGNGTTKLMMITTFVWKGTSYNASGTIYYARDFDDSIINGMIIYGTSDGSSYGYYRYNSEDMDNTGFGTAYVKNWEYLGESFAVLKETTDSIVITGSTTDKEATDTNASSGIAKYYFSKDNGTTWEPNEGQTSTSYTFNGLTPGTTYTFKMKAVDNAGNEIISNAVTEKSYPELKDASDDTKIKYKFGEATITQGGGAHWVSSVVYNGTTYSSSDFVNATEDIQGVIVYNPEGGTYDKKGYYKFIATSVSSGNTMLSYTGAWEYLGESFLVVE